MKNLGLKVVFAAAAFAGVMASSGAAYADDMDWGTVSGAVAVQSDYRFRGISQNDQEIAPQATINWSAPEGFYAGVWASKVNWSGVAVCPTCNANPTVEIDIYGGKHFDLGGWDLNLEAYYYAYPDANPPVFFGVTDPASFFEGIVQLSHSFGDLSVTATGAVSPEFALGGGTGGYVAGTASYPITSWLSISGTVGHQWVELAPSDYTHFDIGLSATYRHFVLDVRANGTDLNSANCNFYMPANALNSGACTTGFVATLTYNIPDLFNL